jgi:hypothetical protein
MVKAGWKVRMYGSSTGRDPIHVSRITVFVIVQNRI